MDDKRENGCYWIAVNGDMARRDCDGEMIFLKPNPTDKLAPYVGTICPGCGRKIFVDEHSYDLIRKS